MRDAQVDLVRFGSDSKTLIEGEQSEFLLADTRL